MDNNKTTETFTSVGIEDLVEAEKSFIEESNCTANCSSTESSTPIQEVPLNYIKIIVLSVIILLTFLGNVAIIFAIAARRSKLTRMYYFILQLSIADLLTAFLTLLPEVIWTFTLPHFYGGVVMCKIIKFTQMLGPYLSSYILIMTAVDRYQAICNPLGNCTWTPKRSQIMISIAWSISLLLCVPQAFIFEGGDDKCQANFAPGWGVKGYVTWFSISNFFLPLCFLLFCYTRICYDIWENGKLKMKDENGQKKPKKKGYFRHWKNCVKRQRGVPTTVTIHQDNQTIVVEDPDAITAFEKLKRKASDASSDDSSIESADRNMLNNELRNAQEMDSVHTTQRITIEPPSNEPKSKAHGGEAENKTFLMPRTHSHKNISRAKIKTVKLTVAVIMGYILCSAPYVCVQLYAVFGSPSQGMLQSLQFLFWLLTLNSVVNPWIYLVFNNNLVESLKRLFCPSRLEERRRRLSKPKRSKKGLDRQNERKSRSVSPAHRSLTLTTTYLTTVRRLSGLSGNSPVSSRKSSPSPKSYRSNHS